MNTEEIAKTGKPVTLHCTVADEYENSVIEWSAVKNDLKFDTGNILNFEKIGISNCLF